MKVYRVYQYFDRGHECRGTFSTREKAENKFSDLGLKETRVKGVTDWRWYSDHVAEEEIE